MNKTILVKHSSPLSIPRPLLRDVNNNDDDDDDDDACPTMMTRAINDKRTFVYTAFDTTIASMQDVDVVFDIRQTIEGQQQ